MLSGFIEGIWIQILGVKEGDHAEVPRRRQDHSITKKSIDLKEKQEYT